MSEDRLKRRRFIADMLFAGTAMAGAGLVSRWAMAQKDPPPTPPPSPSSTPSPEPPRMRGEVEAPRVKGDVAPPALGEMRPVQSPSPVVEGEVKAR
ncbi:MAG: hypothetical protein AMXMBFR33_25340 [Candidatus Xenobia bacterium]